MSGTAEVDYIVNSRSVLSDREAARRGIPTTRPFGEARAHGPHPDGVFLVELAWPWPQNRSGR